MNKYFYICTLAIFSIGFFFVGWYINQPAPILGIEDIETVSLKSEEFETARLRIDGTELKVITNTYSTNRNFIFLDNKTGESAGTLSVNNGWGDAPSYRIVKGNTRDWLVVTRYKSGGTGFLTYSDEWYILGSSYETRKVLSYSSKGNEVLGIDGLKNRYWSTDIINKNYSDDLTVDIKLTEKSCVPTEDGGEKDCSESSRIDHYVWNEDILEFVPN